MTLLVVGNKADRSHYYQYLSVIIFASMLGYVSCWGLHNIAFVVQLHFNELGVMTWKYSELQTLHSTSDINVITPVHCDVIHTSNGISLHWQTYLTCLFLFDCINHWLVFNFPLTVPQVVTQSGETKQTLRNGFVWRVSFSKTKLIPVLKDFHCIWC